MNMHVVHVEVKSDASVRAIMMCTDDVNTHQVHVNVQCKMRTRDEDNI